MNTRTFSYIKLIRIAALAVVMLRGNVRGTTFVMMSDEDLTSSSDVIALGEVQSITTENESIGDIHTAVTIAVEEQIKGMPQSTVTLTLPGGAAGGVRRVVFGAPQFFLGERVIVFLHRRPDGTLLPNGLAMGKYTVVQRAAGAVARRQLATGGAAVLAYDKLRGELVARTGSEEHVLAEFLTDLRTMVAQQPGTVGGSAAMTQPAPGGSRFGDAFTFMGPPPARRVEPDSGATVNYVVDPVGDHALGAAASLGAVRDALATWSGAGSTLRLVDAGPATVAPFQACDGESTIQFNDPFAEIGAPKNCAGVLAVGGFCSTNSSTSTVNGTTFLRITEGDITLNDGFAGCPYWTATNLAEVLTHELGHTIGLAHSSENSSEPDPSLKSATMYYLAHFDGRGAALRSDDILGVRALYPAAVPPTDLRVRVLAITGNSLVANVILCFPPPCTFHPLRDSLAVDLRDRNGILYSGVVGVRGLHPSSRSTNYAGSVSGGSAAGVVAFTWLRNNSASVILRLRSAQLNAASAGPATLSLQLGQRTFVQQVTLLRSGGAWTAM